MLKNYWLIGLRNLQRNRFYTTITIFGLAFGISGCLLIYQFIAYEKEFDKSYSENKDIVRVTSEWFQNNEFLEHRAAAVPALEQIFNNDYPEVLNYARYHKDAINVVRYVASDGSEAKFEENEVYFADASFLEIFDLKFIRGSLATALTGPNKVIITEAIAKKYFGDKDPLGQSMQFDGEFHYTCQVTGVVQDYQSNSHLGGNMIVSLETKVNLVPFEVYNNWIWRSFYTYLVVTPQTDLIALAEKINNGVVGKTGKFYEQRGYKVNFHIQRLQDIHLYSHLFEEMEVNGDVQTINHLTLACIFLLLIAAFNYINLTTAKNLSRAKEVGVRKVAGAYRINLALQYLSESLIVFGASVAISIALIYTTFPYLKDFLQLDFELSLLSTRHFWLLLFCVWFLGGILSGIYPALVLTSMKPTVVLKGNFKNTSGNQWLRKSLVVFQVALSLGLAASVLIISQQIGHMRGRNLGVRKDNVLVIHGPKVKDESYLSNLETFKRTLESIPTVEHMSTVSSLVGEVTGAGRDFEIENGVSQFLRIIRVEDDFDKVMELPLVAGITFSRERVAADSGLVLNEAAVKQMGFANPEEALQRTITWRNVGNPIQSKIVGVIKDYHPNAQSEAVPTVFILNRTYSAPWDPEYYIVSLRANNFNEVNSTVNSVNETWKEIFAADPFTYYFVDDFYNRQFKVEVTFGRIVTLFSALAILLACIGILALASFSNFMRQKEIGIRKVLGSSERQIHLLLLRDYMLLLVVGAIISAPFIFYLFNLWLANFSYRIQLSAWYFLVPSGGLLILMGTIILLQSHRIVMKNPVTVLRSE